MGKLNQFLAVFFPSLEDIAIFRQVFM